MSVHSEGPSCNTRAAVPITRDRIRGGRPDPLHSLASGGGVLGFGAADELIWSQLIRRYRTHGLNDDQLRTSRDTTAHDVRVTVALLDRFGALTNSDRTLRLTALARRHDPVR